MRPLLLTLLALVALGCKPAAPAAGTPPRPEQQRIALVQAIQRADYQGDRAALQRLHQELSAVPEEPPTAVRQRYWEGFALWRRAINGANEKAAPEDLRTDLVAALSDFDWSLAVDPSFDDANVGRISCLQFLAFLDRADPGKVERVGEPLRGPVQGDRSPGPEQSPLPVDPEVSPIGTRRRVRRRRWCSSTWRRRWRRMRMGPSWRGRREGG